MPEKTQYKIWSTTEKMLLNGTLFNQLTVDMICEASHIHRSTFYRHFPSKFNLLEFIVDRLWSSYFSNITVTSLATPFQFADDFLAKSTVSKLLHSQANDLEFLDSVQRLTFQKLADHYQIYLNTADAQFYSGYIVNAIEYIDFFGNKQRPTLNAYQKDELFIELMSTHPLLAFIF